MNSLIKLFLIAVSFAATQSFAFCIYNATTGNDTLRNERFKDAYQAPTVIRYETPEYYGKTVNQGTYGCTLTEQRRPSDISTVNIFIYRTIGIRESITERKCSVNVFNKGGYVIVKGNLQTGFTCDVYRD